MSGGTSPTRGPIAGVDVDSFLFGEIERADQPVIDTVKHLFA